MQTIARYLLFDWGVLFCVYYNKYETDIYSNYTFLNEEF